MYELLDTPLTILTFIALIFLVVGFFSPDKSLFWYKKERTKKMSLIIYLTSFLVFSLIHGGIKPQKLIDEEKQLEEKKKQELLLKEEKQKKVEEKNTVYRIDNCNDFKDNSINYKGFTIEDVYQYGDNDQKLLRDIIEKTKKYTKNKTVKVRFFHLDNNGNSCHVEVDIPVTLEVPNITTHSEKVLLNFTCSKGEIYSGNFVNSITRANAN